jgi:Flp pilus assembly protein TadD
VVEETPVGANQEKGKLGPWIAKALTGPLIFYRGLTWERVKAVASASMNNAAKLLWIALCIFIFVIVVQDLSKDLITVEPISVPKMLSEDGYTPEVASRRLRDALSTYAGKANTSMKSPSIAPRDELPNIVVPKIDLSLETVVSSIRSVLHYGSRRTISGEMIVRGKLIWLRLRVDGQEVFSSPDGFSLENPDELFVAAVPVVMEKIHPYLVASTLYDGDPVKGIEKADKIIAILPPSNVNVQWSYILKGHFLMRQKDYVRAESLFRTAIHLNEANSVAHFNLGNALRDQNKHEQAIAEYRRAIEIDPKDADAHVNLGSVLSQQLKLVEAIAEYRRAVEINPTEAVAHFNLGVILDYQGEFDEAIKEYREAIRINPKHSRAHNNLGFILRDRNNVDDAIAEFRLAIEADPNNHIADNNLKAALREKQEKGVEPKVADE